LRVNVCQLIAASADCDVAEGGCGVRDGRAMSVA
jgi:hypothetical protein